MSGDTFTRDRFSWLDRVSEDRELLSVTFRVAYAITRYVNRASGEAWPSIETLMAQTGASDKTVRRSIDELCKRGHLEKRRAGFGKSNRYLLAVGGEGEEQSSIPVTHDRNDDPIPVTHDRSESSIPVTHDRSYRSPMTGHSGHPRPPNSLIEPFDEELSDLRDIPPTPLEEDQSTRREDQFGEFWKIYPLRVARGAARKAFDKAVKTTPAATIISGARRYAAEKAGKDPKFTKHPATWLNGECWADETLTTTGATIIDQSGNVVGQVVEAADRFQSQRLSPGQQREAEIGAMMAAALRGGRS